MFSGNDLITTFKNLGINTGNVNKLTIESWFDTDDKALLEVLNFISANLQKENVLTAQEEEEYEDLVDNKMILYGQKYENGLKEVETDFVGVLDWKTNEVDTKTIECELELLDEKKIDLESHVEINRNIKKKIAKKFNQTIKENTNWEVRRKNAERKCVELSDSLDNTRNKLHKQIGCYAKQLNEFENSSCPTFLSNVSLKKYEQFVTEMKSCFNLMANDTITSTTPQPQNSYGCESTENLEMLKERIFSSKRCLLDKQIEFEQLEGEIQFMETLNIDGLLLLGYNNDEGSHVNLEASLVSVQMKWDHFILSAEECLKKVANMMVDQPKINVIQNDIQNERKKLEQLNLQHEIITKICSLQKLYYILLEKENSDIQATDTFFREIYLYITENLAERESRIESMLQVTDEYETYKNAPVEKKYKIFGLLKQFYLSKEQNEDSLISVIRNYWNEANNASSQMIMHEIYTTDKLSKELRSQINTLQKFLTTGPTSLISILPVEVDDHVYKVTETIKRQGKALQAAMSTFSNAKKRLANEKWFKLRRLLWIWFIKDPKKLLQIIDEIQVALQSARNNVI